MLRNTFGRSAGREKLRLGADLWAAAAVFMLPWPGLEPRPSRAVTRPLPAELGWAEAEAKAVLLASRGDAQGGSIASG